MKSITRLLVLIMVLTMTMGVFTACGSEEENIEEDVTEVAEAFLDSVFGMDFTSAQGYCDRDGTAYWEMKSAAERLNSGTVYEDLEWLEYAEYEIWEIRISESGMYATVEYSVFDSDDVEEEMELRLKKVGDSWMVYGGWSK